MTIKEFLAACAGKGMLAHIVIEPIALTTDGRKFWGVDIQAEMPLDPKDPYLGAQVTFHDSRKGLKDDEIQWALDDLWKVIDREMPS
jgi:hypothetical protein